MRVIDNKHLDYSNVIQQGDLIKTYDGNYYLFIVDPSDLKNEFPYLQVDIEKAEVVDRYSIEGFDKLKINSYLDWKEEEITEIIKSKNLVLDIRN